MLTGWLGEAQGGDTRALYKVGLSSRRFLLALGDLVVGWLLQRQADVALQGAGRRGLRRRQGVLHGKVAAARFFAREVLPRIGADRRIIEGDRPRHHGPARGGVLGDFAPSPEETAEAGGQGCPTGLSRARCAR